MTTRVQEHRCWKSIVETKSKWNCQFSEQEEGKPTRIPHFHFKNEKSDMTLCHPEW